MTIVTDEMLSIKEGNVKMLESVDEVSGDDLQQLFALGTSACHE